MAVELLLKNVVDSVSRPYLWRTAGCCSSRSSSSWPATGRVASPPCVFPRTSRRCRKPRQTGWGPGRWGTGTTGSGYVWTFSPAWLLKERRWVLTSFTSERFKNCCKNLLTKEDEDQRSGGASMTPWWQVKRSVVGCCNDSDWFMEDGREEKVGKGD